MAEPKASWRGLRAVWIELRGHLRQGRILLTARPVVTLVTVGVILRLVGYLGDRSLWLDEGSLRANIVGRSAGNLFQPMIGTQLAPLGFLASEVAISRWLGTEAMALRLLPLLGGIGALVGFVPLSRRVLTVPGPSSLIALAVFAVAGDLVYYSSELKPYSTDVAAAVACALAGLPMLTGRPSRRGLLGLLGLGVVVVWMSFPSAFVLGGIGLSGIGAALRRGDDKGAAALAGVSLAWLLSFGAAYLVARRLLGEEGDTTMRAFWNFGFPPWPPGTASEALWPLRRVLYLFANPLDAHTRLASWLTPWLALPTAALGGLALVSMGRRNPALLVLLVAPLVLGLAAAYARLYPFHGRLVLFLAPALILLIGEGAGRVLSARPGRGTRALVLILLLAPPLSRYAYRFIQSEWDLTHNHVGDLRSFGLTPEQFPF